MKQCCNKVWVSKLCCNNASKRWKRLSQHQPLGWKVCVFTHFVLWSCTPPQALKAKRAIGVRHPPKTIETSATEQTVWLESVCFHAFRALVVYPPTGFEGKTGEWRETSTKNGRNECYKTSRLAGKCVFSRISCFGRVPPPTGFRNVAGPLFLEHLTKIEERNVAGRHRNEPKGFL